VTATPYTVRLWLPLRRPDGLADTLYTRDWNTAHTPQTGFDNQIELWDDTDNLAAARSWPDRVWHDHTGVLHVELVPLVAHPNETYWSSSVSDRLTLGIPWSDDDHPTVRPLLEAAGWTEWHG
jgi:hypothetical protein